MKAQGPVSSSGLQGSAAALWVRQAGLAFWHGIARRDAASSSRRARQSRLKATCRRWWRRERRRWSRKQLDEMGGGREVCRRARRVHGESDGGRNHVGAGENSGRGGAEEIGRRGRRESRRLDRCGRREGTNRAHRYFAAMLPAKCACILGDKLNLIDRSQVGICVDHRLCAI